MTWRLSSLAHLRFWTLLVLAVVGLQAATPIRAPLDRPPGSAFSASTIDVAVSTARRGDSETAPVQVTPPVPRTLAPVRPEPRPRMVLATPHLRPEARGPPPRDHPSRLPDSTAPPLA